MSAPRYLLDTNILSDLVRHPQGVVAKKIAEVGEPAICTSIVVAAELRFGAERRQSRRLTTQVDAILSAVEILPLDAPADRAYARLRLALEQTGQPDRAKRYVDRRAGASHRMRACHRQCG